MLFCGHKCYVLICVSCVYLRRLIVIDNTNTAVMMLLIMLMMMPTFTRAAGQMRCVLL